MPFAPEQSESRKNLVRCDFIDASSLCQLEALIAFGNTEACALLWATKQIICSISCFHSVLPLQNYQTCAGARSRRRHRKALKCRTSYRFSRRQFPAISKVNAEFYFIFPFSGLFLIRHYQKGNCRGVRQSARRVLDNSSTSSGPASHLGFHNASIGISCMFVIRRKALELIGSGLFMRRNKRVRIKPADE